MSHLRKYDSALQGEAALTEQDLVVGGKVAVLWGGQGPSKDIFAAKIIEICDGPFVQVRFQGYGEAWDRWYSPGDLHVENHHSHPHDDNHQGNTKSILSKKNIHHNQKKGKAK